MEISCVNNKKMYRRGGLGLEAALDPVGRSRLCLLGVRVRPLERKHRAVFWRLCSLQWKRALEIRKLRQVLLLLGVHPSGLSCDSFGLSRDSFGVKNKG